MKKLAFLVAFVVAVGLVFYLVGPRHKMNDPEDTRIKNPDLGTKGGATQVDTETH